ncbi:hypothetical protein, partial [Phascolarctobacterium sp.]|uniref:hypothetical protein n=1 Tax=Phascolarctobacterium sp. TaxID=2049039 RepID=UPI003865DF62
VGDILKEYTNSYIAYLIDEYIHSERDRAILKRRLIDGVLYEALAEEFGLSVVQTKNIVYKLQNKIFKFLQ